MGVLGTAGSPFNFAETVAQIAKKHLANHYERILDRVFIRAEGSWMYDSEGSKYLDFVSCYSALNIGHGHPKIRERLHEVVEDGLYALPQSLLNKWAPECARKICQITGMDRVIFKNSGAEAVEAAMKIARKWGYIKKRIQFGKADLIFCENNFHGRTLGALAASTTTQYRYSFGPHLPGIKIAPFGSMPDLTWATWLNAAAFIFEPIQGEGGIIVPPNGYLQQVRATCDKYGVLMIADEIQTGFGRTGKMFACDWENVKPDVYILGKALGGGLPISAVAGREEVMDVLVPKDDGSTFGGNPFMAAASCAAIDVIVEDELPIKAELCGAYLKNRLREIAKRSLFIKEIRGRGLFLGVELVDGAPSSRDIMRALIDRGVIVNDTKPNVIRIAPPLNISKEEINWGLEKIDEVFTTTVK